MIDYTKFKDCSPEETIFRIRRILHDAGLFPVLKWTPEEYSGMRSNRVYLHPVFSLGTNGKGTSELFAEASAFAELMERIQNGILHIKVLGPEESPYPVIAASPDEKDFTFSDVLAQKDAFIEGLCSSIGYENAFQKELFLMSMADKLYCKKDGTIPCVPFADLDGDRIVWIPAAIAVMFCGSNGMSAGNTMEEALVQGFSEILERYAQGRILKENLTPPEIPADELKEYSLWPLIRQIESSGRFRVSVKDCSLGEGFPVTAVVIADTEKGTFGVKFGCHPSFPISVERTLTEALQGKKMELFTSLNSISNPEYVTGYDNFSNTTKTGEGYYPAGFLGAQPSWEYRPWTQWKSSSNREYLSKIIKLLKEKGFTAYIRDVSHMGFPSYFILVPGMSEIFERSRLRMRDIHSVSKARIFFRKFPDLDDAEEELLLRLIQFKEGSIIENGLDIISGVFLKGPLFNSNRVGGYLALKKGSYGIAAKLFYKASFYCTDELDRKYMICMSEFSRVMFTGADRKDALSVIRFLYGEELAQRAEEETSDLKEMMRKVFPKLQCYDCENCPLAGVHCEYPDVKIILGKLNTAIVHSSISQEELLEQLKLI